MTKKQNLPARQSEALAEHTQNNYHDDARVLLACYINDAPLVVQYEGIKERHARAGELTPLDSAIRNALDIELFTRSKKLFDNYAQIKEAF